MSVGIVAVREIKAHRLGVSVSSRRESYEEEEEEGLGWTVYDAPRLGSQRWRTRSTLDHPDQLGGNVDVSSCEQSVEACTERCGYSGMVNPHSKLAFRMGERFSSVKRCSRPAAEREGNNFNGFDYFRSGNGSKHALTVLCVPSSLDSGPWTLTAERKTEFFIDNILVQNHFIIAMITWAGLAPREFEFRFPGSHTSTFQIRDHPISMAVTTRKIDACLGRGGPLSICIDSGLGGRTTTSQNHEAAPRRART